LTNIPTARDMLTHWTVVVRPDMDLLAAIEVLVNKRANGAAVVNEAEELIGLLTEKDCLRVLANAAYGELAGGRVAEYMSTVRIVISPEMDLFTVAKRFLETNFPVLPVLEGTKLLGRISRLDVLAQVRRFEADLEAERTREAAERQEREHPTSIEAMQRLASTHTPDQLEGVFRGRPRYRR
jgi:predicted transcriptional regulator